MDIKPIKTLAEHRMPIKAALEMVSMKIDATAADLKGSLIHLKRSLILWILVVNLLQMTFIIGIALKLAH